MAKYKITDNATGKTVTISGDHTPSEAEAEQIFKDAGLRQPIAPTQPKGLSYQQGDNPLLYAAAKTQETLRDTQALPIAGGIIGRAITRNPLGTGVGVTAGTALQGLLKPGDTSLKDLIKPGVEAAAWDMALTKLLPLLNLSKTSMKVRNLFITKNGEKMIDGTKVSKVVTEAYNKIPAAQKTASVKKAYEATVSELKDRMIPLGKAVEEKMSYFKPIFSETTGQKLKGTPLNQILESAGQGLRSQIREASPGVAGADDVFAALARAKNTMKWPTRIAAGGAIAGGVGYATNKALGSIFGR